MQDRGFPRPRYRRGEVSAVLLSPLCQPTVDYNADSNGSDNVDAPSSRMDRAHEDTQKGEPQMRLSLMVMMVAMTGCDRSTAREQPELTIEIGPAGAVVEGAANGPFY